MSVVDEIAPARLSVGLPGGQWRLWRTAALRGAGFPADHVLQLAGDREAAAADQYLVAMDEARTARGPARAGLRDAAHADLVRTCLADAALVEARLGAIVADPRFQEAMLWQTRGALSVVLRRLRDWIGSPSKRRRAAEFAAMYVQRYAVKNDSIGFFGPIGWASLTEDPIALDVRTEPELAARGEVHFEGWCIEALTERLNQDHDLKPWVAPRLASGVWCTADAVYAPLVEQVAVTQHELDVLRLCDGHRTAVELADLVRPPSIERSDGQHEVFAILDELCRRELVVWRLEVPSQIHPERELERRLGRVGDPAVRARCMASLDALCAARRRVARAAGRPGELEQRLTDLEATFTHVTGESPTRRAGQTYAARTLVYEDCRRGCTVTLGAEFLDRAGPALSIVLDGAAWLAAELAEAVRPRLRERHAELRERFGADIDAHRFYTEVGETDGLRQFNQATADVVSSYQRAWQSILDIGDGAAPRRCYRSVDLAPRFAQAFRTRGHTWVHSRYVSPDIMVAAAGAEAFRRGDFEVVIGEIHGVNSLLYSVFQENHPDPDTLAAALAYDTRDEFVLTLQTVRDRWLARMSPLTLPTFWRYEYKGDLSNDAHARSMPAGMLVAVDDGEMIRIRARDGSVDFDALEIFGPHLCAQLHPLIAQRFPRAPHTPRITIDCVTIVRETWLMRAEEMPFCGERDAYKQFAEVRRWARSLGMPRQVFYKSPRERKPCYLDFDSRLCVETFLKQMKRVPGCDDVRLSEMWPDVEQAWLPDAAGRRYTCEFRIAARRNGSSDVPLDRG